ncbi:hypothetical protein [Phormidium sp. CCY1219]|nr:hypothetical protein [Phormidium sp. CCY1219]MEB3830027.1 hypothetical protein [Phormidium sp. CCY1219]
MKTSIYLSKVNPTQRTALFENPKPAAKEIIETPYSDILSRILQYIK